MNPYYNAFRCFAALHGAGRLSCLSNDPRFVTVAGATSNEVLVLLAHHEPFQRELSLSGTLPLFDYFEPDWDRTLPVRVQLTDVPMRRYDVEVYAIDRDHGTATTVGGAGQELDRIYSGGATGSSCALDLEVPVYGVQLVRLVQRTNQPADTDADGLPDAWEQARFGGLFEPNGAPGEDPDRDGQTNLEEFLGGTDPLRTRDATELFIDVPQSTPVVAFFAAGTDAAGYAAYDRYYAVESTDDPAGAPWKPVAGYERLRGADETVALPDASASMRSFRLRAWLEYRALY